MRRTRATVAAGLPMMVLLGGSTGCSMPCDADADCPSTHHCSTEDRVCAALCEQGSDCEGGEVCRRGRCEVSYAPSITWVEPTRGARVGDRFDVVVDVRFRGPELIARLVRDPARPGEPCAPMPVHELRIEGDVDGTSTQRLVFHDVPALGEEFALALLATANHIESRSVLPLRATAPEGFGGARIRAPLEGLVDADLSYTQELQVDIEGETQLLRAWTEPEAAPPSPQQLLTAELLEARGLRLPLARGPQVLWLELEGAEGARRCGVGLSTLHPAHAGELEVALAFESDHDADLELRVFAEAPDGAVSLCTTRELAPLWCVGARDASANLEAYDEEALYLAPSEGVYGIAVLPGAATGPVRAQLRLSNRGVHLGWLGPRSLQTDRGEVWLAGRIYVLGGEVRIEPVDALVTGSPAGPPSAW